MDDNVRIKDIPIFLMGIIYIAAAIAFLYIDYYMLKFGNIIIYSPCINNNSQQIKSEDVIGEDTETIASGTSLQSADIYNNQGKSK